MLARIKRVQNALRLSEMQTSLRSLCYFLCVRQERTKPKAFASLAFTPLLVHVHTRLVARGEASPLKRFFSYFLSLQEIGAPRVSGEKKIPLRSPLELKRKAAPSSFCGAFYINSPFSHNFRCIFCCNQYSFMI